MSMNQFILPICTKDLRLDSVEVLQAILLTLIPILSLLVVHVHILEDLPLRNIFHQDQTIGRIFISLGHMDSRMNMSNKTQMHIPTGKDLDRDRDQDQDLYQDLKTDQCHHHPNLLMSDMTPIKDPHPGVQVTTPLMDLAYNHMTTNHIHNPAPLVLPIHQKVFEGVYLILNHLV